MNLGRTFTDNVEAEKTFYQQVFGWQYENNGSGKDAYTLIRVNARPISGIVHYASPPMPSSPPHVAQF